jgi:hypothetical protein
VLRVLCYHFSQVGSLSAILVSIEHRSIQGRTFIANATLELLNIFTPIQDVLDNIIMEELICRIFYYRVHNPKVWVPNKWSSFPFLFWLFLGCLPNRRTDESTESINLECQRFQSGPRRDIRILRRSLESQLKQAVRPPSFSKEVVILLNRPSFSLNLITS